MAHLRRDGDPVPVWPTYHFSVDDVFECLLDASDRCRDVFEQPLLGWLRDLHERFGICADLYVFEQGRVDGVQRTLAHVSSRFREQFQAARWLRFGPHGQDYELPPHRQTPDEQRATFESIYREIDRFAGPGKTTRWNRLHFFSECYELAAYFLERGSDVLLLTDKPAAAYRLPEPQRCRLAAAGRLTLDGLHLLQSHFRFECFERDGTADDALRAQLDDTLHRRGYVSLFTHEVELARPGLRALAERTLEYTASVAWPADVAPLGRGAPVRLLPPLHDAMHEQAALAPVRAARRH